MTIRKRDGWGAALWAIVGLGVLVRIVRYAADRSLWGDEGALALNIVQRSPRELLEPLDYAQGAPTGFLLAEKAVTYVLGEDELALRFFPLLSGIVALILVALIARRILRREAAVLAVALAAFSDPLVYFSSEVKQYETDVLAALVLLYGALAVDWGRVRVASGVVLAAAGAVVVWFSHPALLVLPSLLTVLLVSAWLRRDRAALRALAPLGVVWGASVLGSFVLNRKNSEVVADAAIGSEGSTGQGISEPLKRAWDAHADVVGVADTVTALAAVFAVAGLVVLARRSPTHAGLLVVPGAATFLAAVVGRYPFSGRFILFLAPALILLVAEGAVALVAALPPALVPAGAVGIFLLLVYPVAISASRAFDPPGHEEVKSVLRTIEKEWKRGDALHVYSQSQYPFRYYVECDGCGVLGRKGPATVVWPPDRRDLPGPDALATREPDLYLSANPHDLQDYLASFSRVDGRRRVWFLFSSTWDDAFVQQTLDCMGRRLLEARATRAVAYLYDLSAPRASASCAG